MSMYIIRVQLLDATARDLKTLDVEMEKNACLTTRKNLIGKEQANSPIEYSYSGKMILPELSIAVAGAAKKTDKKFSFTVMKEKSPIHSLLS